MSKDDIKFTPQLPTAKEIEDEIFIAKQRCISACNKLAKHSSPIPWDKKWLNCMREQCDILIDFPREIYFHDDNGR